MMNQPHGDIFAFFLFKYCVRKHVVLFQLFFAKIHKAANTQSVRTKNFTPLPISDLGRMNLFFDIPKVHQVDLLAGWLRPMDVGKLDSAVMCHKHRKELMDLLSSPECVLGCLEFMWEGTMEWIMHRQAKFTSIYLSNRVLSDGVAVEKVMQIIGPTLKSLEYSCSIQSEEDLEDDESLYPTPISMDQILYIFVRYMTALESVKLCDGAVDGMLSALINSNRNTLKSIDLSECSNVCASVLKACCDSPSLEEVIMCNGKFTEDFLSFSAKPNTTVQKLSFFGGLDTVQSLNYVNRFSHLRYVEAHLGDAELALVSMSCKLVEHARIAVSAPLTLPLATEVAKYWKDIVQLEITPTESETRVCDQNVTLLFINRCLKLQELILAAPMRPRIDDVPFKPIAISVDESRTSYSHLRELMVSQLSKSALKAVIKKCPELHTLCIHRPVPTYMGSQGHEHAEFSLEILNNTKVKNLSLIYCMDFTIQQIASLHCLEKLELHYMGDDPSYDRSGREMIQFVQQCPTLHTLHLHHCSFFHDDNVLPLLHAAPSVVDFEYTPVGADNRPALSPAELLLQEVMGKLFPRLVYFEMRS